jgi:hypothetical protein
MNTIVRYLDRVLLLTVAAIVSLVIGWSAQAASDTPQIALPQSVNQARPMRQTVRLTDDPGRQICGRDGVHGPCRERHRGRGPEFRRRHLDHPHDHTQRGFVPAGRRRLLATAAETGSRADFVIAKLNHSAPFISPSLPYGAGAAEVLSRPRGKTSAFFQSTGLSARPSLMVNKIQRRWKGAKRPVHQ